MRSVVTLFILGTLALLFSLLLASPLPSGPWFPRREDPKPGPNDLSWAGGKVVVWDYSSFPGTYDYEVKWFGPHGESITLLDAGDTGSVEATVRDGVLVVRTLKSRTRIWVEERFKSLPGRNAP